MQHNLDVCWRRQAGKLTLLLMQVWSCYCATGKFSITQAKVEAAQMDLLRSAPLQMMLANLGQHNSLSFRACEIMKKQYNSALASSLLWEMQMRFTAHF